jgi:hypothetical protein
MSTPISTQVGTIMKSKKITDVLPSFLDNFTDEEKKTLGTAYSNYISLDASGVTNMASLPAYVTANYGVNAQDALNYNSLKGMGITTIADVQTKINNAVSTNAGSSNEIKMKDKNRYFIHTNTQCKDLNGKSQYQSILINNISDDTLWKKYNSSLMYSSSMTSSQSAGANRMRQLLSNMGADSLASMDKCRGVAVYTDSTKSKTIRGYVSLSDYNNLDPSVINNDQSDMMNSSSKSESNSPVESEGFTPISHVYDDEKPYADLENNIITKFYFVSITVILLYILFRLYEKSR